MKTLTALLLLGLLCSLHTTSAAVIALETATECCMHFTQRIPLNQVVSLRATSSSCPRKALIFTTQKGKTFCVDPSEAWVQSHVTKIESRSTMMSSTAVPS